MSDQAIQNAKAVRDRLAAEINQTQERLDALRKELADADRFIADWSKFAEIDPVEDPMFRYAAPIDEVRPPKNPDREEVGAAAKDIIVEAGRPVMRSDLFKLLKQRGLELFGKDPEMVLSTMMWRMQDRFVRLPGGGYWLRDKPCPAIGYKPGDIPLTEGVKKILKPV